MSAWKAKHPAPPDWPTIVDYESARRAAGPCPPHDWKPAKSGGHECSPCGATLPAAQPGYQHLPIPSRFTGG
jgi:hypothetical protein